MNALIINGSPRNDGIIKQILNEIAAETRRGGHEVTVVNIAELDVAPCRGCMACRSSKRCVLPPDGAQDIIRKMEQCDALVIGAPCYWGNIPGQLKTLFDRMVYGMIGESPRGIPLPLHNGKTAAIVTACSTRWPWSRLFNQSSGALKALREIMRWSGFKVAATLQRSDTRRQPLNEADLRKARQIAQRVMREG